MAGKTVESRAPIDLATLKLRVEEKYRSELFDHPEGYGVVEIARLKRREREEIQTASRRADGLVDVAVQNRMAASFGLVNPRLTAEELKEYPDDFIEPIADRVWALSNEYRDREGNGKGNGTGPDPFTKTSSLSTDSPSPSTGPSSTSKTSTTTP